MLIEKSPKRTTAFARPVALFNRARDAFSAYLRALGPWHDEVVLLPAYVGWSPREGSGVLDPVSQLGLRYAFYALDDRLNIDVVSVQRCLDQYPVRLFVIIHFFGFIDPAYEEVVGLAQKVGVTVLEDEAHAMLTDLTTGRCGRLGDAAVFSLHKLLPVPSGGALVLNTDRGASAAHEGLPIDHIPLPWSADLFGISGRRRDNYWYLQARLKDLEQDVTILRPLSYEVPQSMPVLIKNASRDMLYAVMNDAGYGCVSLYHTLVSDIDKAVFPSAHAVSRRIFNLPVHQDVMPEQLDRLVDCLAENIIMLGASGR